MKEATPPKAVEVFEEPLHDPEQLREHVEEAARELIENASEYGDLIKALREKKPADEIIKELGEAITEGVSDYRKAAPAIRETTQILRDGASTSEFKMYSAVNRVLTIVAILAPVIEGILAVYQANMGDNPSFGGSMIVTGVSVFLKTFIADRYNKGRVVIKQQAALSPFELNDNE